MSRCASHHPRRASAGVLGLGLALALVAGLAGCTATLQEQGARQEASLSDLRATVDGLRADLQGLRGEVTALRDALEIEVRRTTGERATEDARARDTKDALDTRLATTERRVEEMADGLAGVETSVATLAEQLARVEAGSATATTIPRTRPRGPRPPGISPEELFDRGMESFRAGELGQAVLDWEEFADKHPNHPLAPSVQFWIGEAYFRSRDFEQAASKYQKAIDLAPTGERTPDALLRLGLAQRSLRREDRAREVWARLLKDFPDSEAAVRARAVLRQPARAVPSAEPR